MINIYNDSNITITYPDIIYSNRPYCVFGVLKNEEGLKIKDEMLKWLSPVYNVYIVEQDKPGHYFEYPALRFLYDIILEQNLDYCLYVHTKGAVNVKPFAKCVRNFWEDEFTNYIDWYKNTLLSNSPIVAVPATGKFNTTWLNGFFVNYQAAKETVLKEEFSNRYYYETIYRGNNTVKVIGRLRNDVDDNTKTTKDTGKKEYIDYIKSNYGDLKKNLKKKVIYTCITGGYDNLRKIKFYDPKNFDYVCFTDNENINNHGQWIIKNIPEDLSELSNVRKQRNIKICPHKYLSEYDISIWIDGSIEVRGDVMSLINGVINDDITIYIPQHPCRKCIYKEAEAVLKIRKDKPENVNPQMEHYRKEKFPRNYGLVQSNIIIRKHNEPDCIKVMNTWANELNTWSHRDQLSFNYALWKNQEVKIFLLDKKIYNSKWFKWETKHAKGSNNGKIREKIISNLHPSIKIRKKKDGVISNSLEKQTESKKVIVTRRIIPTVKRPTKDRIDELRTRINNLRSY